MSPATSGPFFLNTIVDLGRWGPSIPLVLRGLEQNILGSIVSLRRRPRGGAGRGAGGRGAGSGATGGAQQSGGPVRSAGHGGAGARLPLRHRAAHGPGHHRSPPRGRPLQIPRCAAESTLYDLLCSSPSACMLHVKGDRNQKSGCTLEVISGCSQWSHCCLCMSSLDVLGFWPVGL